MPILARMHRLVQELAASTPERKEKLMAYALNRAEKVGDEWLNKAARWEIEPVGRLALFFLEQDWKEGAALPDRIVRPLVQLGRFADARVLLQRAIDNGEKHFGSDDPRLGTTYSNLAQVERELGNLSEAKRLSQRAI